MGFSIQLPGRDLLKFGEFLLRNCGVHPDYNTFGYRVRLLIPFLTGSILTILTSLNTAQPTKTLIDFAGKLEAFLVIGQVSIKVIILLYYRQDFSLLLKECGEFWKIEEFENTPIKHELRKLMDVSILAYKLFVLFAGLSCLGLMLQPELPIMCYIPNKFYLNIGTTYVIEIIILLYVVPMLLGYDAVFTGFCTHVLIQLKMIQYILENLTFSEFDETKQLMKKCVVHHQKLLRFIRKMKKVYSVSLMGQIGMTIFTLSIELCIVAESVGDDYIQAYKSFVCGFSVFYQFGLYCFPAAEVTAEAEQISQAMYNSKWYEMSAPFKRDILIIMARSQQEISFSPGGIGVITRETLAMVAKTAFSVLTMMKTIKGNQ